MTSSPFSLLAVVAAVAGGAVEGGAETGGPALPIKLLALVLLAAFLHVVVKRLLERFVADPYERDGRLTPDRLAVMLVGVFLTAVVCHELHVATLIGAFLFGTAVPRRGHLTEEAMERLEGVSVLVLLPIFFVVTGLSVDVKGLGWSGVGPMLLIIVVASVGKFVGGAGAARLTGSGPRQSLAVGTLMNTRGLAELVVLNLGRELGVLDTQLFTMLVIMAVVTTLMTGPLLRLVYPDRWIERDVIEAERALLGGEKAYRVLVFVDRPERADALVRAAVGLCGAVRPAELLLTHLTDAGTTGSDRGELVTGISRGVSDLAAAMGALQQARVVAESAGIRCVVTSRLSDDIGGDIVTQATHTSVDAVLMGWPEGDGAAAHRLVVDQVLARAACDVLVAAGPSARDGAVVLVPDDDGGALEVAARSARGWQRTSVDIEAGRSRSSREVVRQLERVGLVGTVRQSTDGQLGITARLDDGVGVVVVGVGRSSQLEATLSAVAASTLLPMWIVRAADEERPSLAVRLAVTR